MIFKSKTLMYSVVMKIKPIVCQLGALKLRSGCVFLKMRLMEKLLKPPGKSKVRRQNFIKTCIATATKLNLVISRTSSLDSY